MTKLNKVKLISKFNLVINLIMVNWPKIKLPFFLLYHKNSLTKNIYYILIIIVNHI
jgi:hypothetical protein